MQFHCSRSLYSRARDEPATPISDLATPSPDWKNVIRKPNIQAHQRTGFGGPLFPSADKPRMTGVRREPRIAVMILVEASWQDPSGILLTAPARMEDKSAGGACIRLRRNVGVGARLKIQCRREQFSGIARYCRNVGMEYLVGIQRDPVNVALQAHPRPIQAATAAQIVTREPTLNPAVALSLPPQLSEATP